MNNDSFNENHLEITKIQGLGKNRTLEGKGQSRGQCIGVAQYTDIKLIKMSDYEMPGDWTSGLLDCLISKRSKVTISFKDFSFISKSYAKNDLETDLVPIKRPL